MYPATVGSSERPSPTGDLKVTAIAENPTYHYDPALNLRGVDVQEKLELPPGPNNPSVSSGSRSLRKATAFTVRPIRKLSANAPLTAASA